MKKIILFILLFAFGHTLRATHNIAGEITLVCTGPNTYKAIITTYTNTASPADRCELTVDWGDNTTSIAPRVNGTNLGPCWSSGEYDGDTQIMLAAGYPNTRMNIYEATHPYPGPGTYRIDIKDPNRVAGIINIPNSVNVPFFLRTELVINPFIGCNSTPYLTTYPLDKACIGHCFYHNPGAIDPDGDSLSYDIGNCLDTNAQVIAGYIPLSSYGGVNIDHVTGDLSWCSPTVAGKYNLIISITEWKRMPDGTRINIGTVYRDMSIEVSAHCDNENPDIPPLPDLCVTAGDTVAFGFNVSDPDGDNVQMDGYGPTFTSTPPAILTPSGSMIATMYRDSFNWVTTCENVRLQPWGVTLKAKDDGTPPLLDIETVNITVVSPGPAFLNATPSGSSINLNWGINPCDPTNNHCRGYKIFRHQGPTSWVHAQCETGVPAYTGFIQIGTVTGLGTTTFTDDNGGQGLIPGVDYCYRVCAYFNDAAESYSSPEVCTELLRDVPVITNVDVMTTGSNDQIWVGWANPLANGFDYDTTINPGQYKIVVERCSTMNFNVLNSTIVATFTVDSFYQLPTHFIDNGLNTVGQQYSYRLTFFDDTTHQVGHCQPASSVFLTTTPSDNRVNLSWVYNVPWTNYAAAIYRFNSTTLLWDSLTTANGDSYVDDSLQNSVQYCYYITTHGSYFNATLPPELYNRSQQACATPLDLTAPCAPFLAVNSDCYNSINDLIWTDPMNMNCGTDDVVQYHVYYSATDSGSYSLLSVLAPDDDTTITYSNLFSVAGCYVVTAIDTFGNESVYSNAVCIDNCPDYELPNVFTPNGDGTNDWFIPFPYKYIQDVDIRIYDRWGTLVFETKDPALKWDGRDMTTHKLCTDGVYYYTALVNEIHLSGIQPRELKGFVHLFGEDIGQFH